jgi:hypothetical protein
MSVQVPLGIIPTFVDEAATALQKRGMTLDDVDKWAWIVSAESADGVAERFISADCAKPPFLLLEILRRDLMQVRNLKSLLSWMWCQLAGTSEPPFGVSPESELGPRVKSPFEDQATSRETFAPLKMEDTTITTVITRFLYHARRICPPAIVSAAHVAALIIHSIPKSKDESPVPLNSHMHIRVCKIHNHIVRQLALPASISPLRSMDHNWEGQKILIEMTRQFTPPLILNQESYRAVVQVLGASKKSEREARVANLRSRTWPPWRIEQDGIDAQRSLEDDLSRVVSAGIRAREAGYAGNTEDEVRRIVGGQEHDGTPTIQTRKLIKQQYQSVQPGVHPESNPDLWAARIVATRDIQEAWGAFKNFVDQGGNANQPMYLAMFEKLNYHELNSKRKARYSASPGDGREVLMPLNDNMSDFYRRHVSPPTFDELYDKMILRGIRPSGRLLTFLLGHARTLERGMQYLCESQLDSQAVAFLAGNTEIPPAILSKVPASTFAAFITLLCRFAPRAILVERPASAALDEDDDSHATGPVSVKYVYRILEPRAHTGEPIPNTLHRSMDLLTASETKFRPAWYALFRALARRNVVIDRDLFGDPRNDLLSWQVLFAALRDFQSRGLELDPAGFLIICRGLEKAIIASFDVPQADKSASFTKCPETVITEEFLKLSGTVNTDSPYTPGVLHSFDGLHIHAYVRVLGLLGDHEGILRVLEWMSTHHKTLDSTAAQTRNGRQLIRRVHIAMRVFLHDTLHEAKAAKLIESVESWGGWPQEVKALQYLDYGRESHRTSIPYECLSVPSFGYVLV